MAIHNDEVDNIGNVVDASAADDDDASSSDDDDGGDIMRMKK